MTHLLIPAFTEEELLYLFPGDFAAGVATTFHPLARMLTGI